MSEPERRLRVACWRRPSKDRCELRKVVDQTSGCSLFGTANSNRPSRLI